jgi:hypothetical protein
MTLGGEAASAWYAPGPMEAPTFLSHSTPEILGHLFQRSHLPPDPEQRDAWSASIDLLKPLLLNRAGHLLLEFNIPRMGLRADAVLLLPGCVVIQPLPAHHPRAGAHALAGG